jgi:DNA-binding NtrC family response regulator
VTVARFFAADAIREEFMIIDSGIRFGSSERDHPSVCRSSSSDRSHEHMDESTGLESSRTEAAWVPRQRERRQGLASFVSTLSRGIGRRSDVSLLRGALEDMLRRVVPVRSVQLRDVGSRWAGTRETGGGLESISLEIGGPDGSTAAVLEATLEAGGRLGDWDLQILNTAAQLAAFVLEIERSRIQLARAGLLESGKPRRDGAAPLIGSTPAMHGLRSAIERVAGTDFTVLLEGESGVGKELVARQIHDLSRRRSGPFVAINCAALVETLLEAELFGIEERTATGVRGRRGKFEHADGGTLFLDEVSDLSPSAQAKLLRAVQDLAVERVGGAGTHRVDIRVIAATNRRLCDLVEQNLFRPDLYYRLSGVDIRVPSLRERRHDILELANYFLERHRAVRRLKLSTGASDAMLAYAWPGNVRELERMIERAVALSATSTIELDDLPPTVLGDYGASLSPSLARNDTLRAWAARYARLVVARSDGNRRKAARALGISYHTLQSYLRFPIFEAQPAGDDPPVAVALEA